MSSYKNDFFNWPTNWDQLNWNELDRILGPQQPIKKYPPSRPPSEQQMRTLQYYGMPVYELGNRSARPTYFLPGDSMASKIPDMTQLDRLDMGDEPYGSPRDMYEYTAKQMMLDKTFVPGDSMVTGSTYTSEKQQTPSAAEWARWRERESAALKDDYNDRIWGDKSVWSSADLRTRQRTLATFSFEVEAIFALVMDAMTILLKRNAKLDELNFQVDFNGAATQTSQTIRVNVLSPVALLLNIYRDLSPDGTGMTMSVTATPISLTPLDCPWADVMGANLRLVINAETMALVTKQPRDHHFDKTYEASRTSRKLTI
jgi:hypothetical protein